LQYYEIALSSSLLKIASICQIPLNMGFTAYDDPVLGRAVAKGRRKEFAAFGWQPHEISDPQAYETFVRSQLNWDELTREPHAGLLNWHRRLIRLRRGISALSDGRLDRVRVRFDEEARWLVVERGLVSVVCNLADRIQRVPVSMPQGNQALLTSDPTVEVTADGVRLLPDAVALLGPQAFSGFAVRSDVR
jgi:maltooligosyltrehalose trehalohydrolase